MNTKPVLFIALFLLLAVAAIPVQAKPLKDTLVIAISHDFHPFTFVNTDGKPAGMFVDIWRLWAKKNGQTIEFISSDWKTSLENLKAGKADIHSGLIHSPLRSRWMSETRTMYQAEIRYFYPLRQGKLGDFGKLSGETVAVVRGSEPEEYLRRQHPDIRVLSCQNREELLRVARAGTAKGFILLAPVGSALIDRHGLTGEFEKNGAILYREDFHPGVLKERKALAAYVDKGLSAITPVELAEIEARWIADPAKRYFKQAGRVSLTPAEDLWLQKHPTIRVGMSPVLPPLKFSENGIIKGVEPDYLREIAERTGLKFQFVTCSLAEMDAKVKAGELDMFLSFNIPERLGYMTFTHPFMDFKQVVIARSDAPFIATVAALQGKRVATIKGVKLHDKILAPFPDIRRVPCDTLEQAFRAVAGSKADALLSKTLFAGHLMSRYPDLKIAGVLDLPPEPYMYAVRKDYPELVGILNKGITGISREKHDAIVHKWLSLRLDYRPNWSGIREWLLLAGGVGGLVIGLTLYWNRRLAREIARQKEVEQSLLASESKLRVIFETSEAGIILVSPSGLIDFANSRAAEMFGWTPADFIGTRYVDHLHESELQVGSELMGRLIGGDIRTVSLDRRYRRRDGSDFWGHLSGNRLENADGSLRALIGVITDISQRRQLEETLVQNNEQLQFVLQGSQLGFWDWDMETGMVTRNERWAEMLGYTLREVELTVRQWTDLIHPDDRARAWQSIQDHLEGRIPCHVIEYRMRRKDGQYVWILDQARIVKRGDDGRPLRMTGTHTDITERKLAEQNRIREQVENEERARLARELHDSAGQSLQAIRLHLRLLADGRGEGDLSLELRDLAQAVADTAGELRDLAHQVRPSYLQEVELDTAIQDRCAMLRRRGVPVDVDCSGSFAGTPYMISDNIYRIFQEALTNAARHAATRRISVALSRTEAALRLVVSDDGCGMGEGRSGTGLGLQIMHERAALIGADLSVMSDTTGTTVSLTLEGI